MKIRQFAVAVLLIAGLYSVMSTPALADSKFKVVTTFTVIADMAQNVAGDSAEVVSVTRPGAEIHGYQPTPRDLVNATDADLVLWNGLNLELWFEQFIENLGEMPSVILSDGIDPISISSGSYEGKANPHAWIGPDAAMIYIDNIRDALSKYDPDNAETYSANAESYKERVRATIEPLREKILAIPEDQRWLVTCEGAFSYLARDLGLKELYLWPMNADRVGTPQQVRLVIDAVRENNIPVVFCESTVNTSPAKQVARETGARYGGELYVDSLSEAGGPVPTYLDLLKVTLETVSNGLTASN